MSKLYIYAAIGVALVGGIVAFALHQRSVGGDAERAKQEKENAQFNVKVRQGLVSYDECDRADGVYNFRKGTCQLP